MRLMQMILSIMMPLANWRAIQTGDLRVLGDKNVRDEGCRVW